MGIFTEDSLVQQTTADYLENKLGWDSVYAYNYETFEPDGTLGRDSEHDIVLSRYLRKKLVAFNPGYPNEVYDDAIRKVKEVITTQTLVAINKDKYDLVRNGIQVTFRNSKGERERCKLRIINFEEPTKNHFLCVRELWIKGDLYRRRPDIIGFVNGIPFIFMELKTVSKDVRMAYDQNYKDYLDTVPHLFHHNAIVLLANGISGKIGTITSKYEHFHEWKRLEEEEEGVVDMETMLMGICKKDNLIDILENFILFDDSSGDTKKILARNHQFLGVNRAVTSVKERKQRNGKLGVFWHTQGAGKSYSMVFFTRKIHRKYGGNFTFLILTDRDDLDTQIYKTFAGCEVVNHDSDPCRPSSGRSLHQMMTQQKSHVFTLIQKFNKVVNKGESYSERNDIIVITDEAHRTQYGTLALNLRNALPNASYIGFTGTPLFQDDEITKRVFGEYVSTYDFQRAVDDNATVPLYYDARGDKLGISIGNLNEKIAEKVEELEVEDVDVQQRLENELKRDYHIITADKRLDQIAKDFVQHYSKAWESGKAMLVCIDKITCVRMYNRILDYWKKQITILESKRNKSKDQQEEVYLTRQITWMKQTEMAVVISEEQGEVDKFKKWDLDIKPHRRLIKEGISLPESMRNDPRYKNMQRMDVDEAFKNRDHPFRIVIVCAMWLTGFDVPSLSTLYLDKPLKAHTLMQAIARANRVDEGKNNGLIIDYCGIMKHLRRALATFSGQGDSGHKEKTDEKKEPAKPDEELLEDLINAIAFVKSFLSSKDASLEDIIEKTGFERNAAILLAKESANYNDKSRKRFEILCREVFKKFKASLNAEKITDYQLEYAAIRSVYQSLQKDSRNTDISSIIKQLHKIVDEAIETKPEESDEKSKPYDLSRIDFELLRKEFEKSPRKRTTVQNLKQVIENKLHKLLAQNPLRIDFQQYYENIITSYNSEKDRVTIEATFQKLLRFIEDLDHEEKRAVREGLDQESLAIFDLLVIKDLSKNEINRIKEISVSLLQKLKAEKLRIDQWREKEATRDAVMVTIEDFLWSDDTGLPVDIYSEDDVKNKAKDVYRHIFRNYPELPSPFYSQEVA